MAKKLDNDIIDQRLQNKIVKRIGDYKNRRTKLEFICTKCNKYFIKLTNSVINSPGNGCPYLCSNTVIMWTNDLIDEYLENKTIKRVGDYKKSSEKLEFYCEICENSIYTYANYILHNGSCGNCRTTTNETLDFDLENLNSSVKRIGNFIDSISKIEFECTICLYKWKSLIYGPLRGTGCIKCANKNKLLSNDEIDLRLSGRKIIRIGNYIGYNKYIDFKCLICNRILNYLVCTVLSNKNCEFCFHKRLTNTNVDERVKLRFIERIGDVYDSNSVIEWKCLKCNKNWNAKVANVLSGICPCINCNKSFGEKSVQFILEKNNIIFESQYKIHIEGDKKYKSVDFYIKKYNCIIEYNGIQHYKDMPYENFDFAKQVDRDLKIKQYCIINNINLLEIDSRNFRKFIVKIDKSEFYNKLETFILEYFGEINE